VIVVGAGVAGTSAAISAATAARTTVIDGGTGASTLSTGAVDVTAWTESDAPARPLSPAARQVLQTLGGFTLPEGGARLLTSAGIVRPAHGHDAALLDLGPLAAGRVGVVRCGRAGWDAVGLARAWGDRFEALDATVLRMSDERALPDADFAARHDDDDRLGWLAERLRDALARTGGVFSALVLPPSLGVERARAEALSKHVGIPCGEAIGLPGGPSGLRFERARDRALAAAGVNRLRDRTTAVERTEGSWRVHTESGHVYEGDSVVLATGGLLGGGVEYAPSETVLATVLPPAARPPLRLAIRAPVSFGSRGRPLELPGSLFGLAPESVARPFARDALLDRAGVLVEENGVSTGVAGGDLFAVGDLAADQPRTWLGALCAGVRAGVASARGTAQRRDAVRSIA
jgi:hypothetical protein